MSNAIVKNLNFGLDAKDKVFAGITKLTQAVSSTLGASGKCVILEDNTGKPIIPSNKYKEIVATPIFHPKVIPTSSTTKVCIVIGTG